MDKSALQRFFLNQCSGAERKEVIGWLLNPGNDSLIMAWMKENWDLIPISGAEHISDEPDVKEIWSKLSEKLFEGNARIENSINEHNGKDRPETSLNTPGLNDAFSDAPGLNIPEQDAQGTEVPVRSINSRITKARWLVAASVIMVLGLFAYAYRESILYIRYQTDYAQVTEFNLPDGSHVVLNANSSLLVPRWGFNDGDRKVELRGEAAFKVKHTVNHQKFLVATNGSLNVEVLGTEFLVYSRNEKNRVVLKEGSVKVRFNNEQHQPVLMKPGDVVTADKAGSLSVKHQQPVTNSIPWKDHRFEFESTSLNDVISHVSEFFGDNIVLKGETIGNKTITGSFTATSAHELLTIICEMYNLELEQTKDKIILKEKNAVLMKQ